MPQDHAHVYDDKTLEDIINVNLLQHKTVTMWKYLQANLFFLVGKWKLIFD